MITALSLLGCPHSKSFATLNYILLIHTLHLRRTLINVHNGLIGSFILIGKRMNNYCLDDIAFINDLMDTLPRKILGYKTP